MAVSAVIGLVAGGAAYVGGAAVAAAVTTGLLYAGATAVTKKVTEEYIKDQMKRSASAANEATKGYSLTAGGEGTDLPEQIIIGKTRASGVRVYEAATGDENKFLHRVLVFNIGESSFDTLYINGQEVDDLELLETQTGGIKKYNVKSFIDDETGQSSGLYDGYITVWVKDRNCTEASYFEDLVSATTNEVDSGNEWTSNHQLRNHTSIYVQFKYDQDVFPTGVPTITANLEGIRCLDTRTASPTYTTTNPAMVLREYLTNDYFGCGIPSSMIDDASFETAADYCDAVSIYALNYTSDSADNWFLRQSTLWNIFANAILNKRFTVNGILTTRDTHRTNLEILCNSFLGQLVYNEGKFRLRMPFEQDKDAAGEVSFDESDFRSGLSVATRYSRDALFNTVKGTFSGPETGYQPTDYPSVVDSTLLADDGYEKSINLNFPLTQSSKQIHNLARVQMLRMREQIQVSCRLSLKALQLSIGDTLKLNSERFGWTNKRFEVLTWDLVIEEDGRVEVEVTLKEYTSVWNGLTFVDPDVLEANNTNLGSQFSVPQISMDNLYPYVIGELNKDGTALISALFSWSLTSGSSADVAYYDFEWSVDNGTTYNSIRISSTNFKLSNLISGIALYYKITPVNQLGVRGTAIENNISSLQVVNDITIPEAPTLNSVTGGYRSNTLVWTAPTSNTTASGGGDFTDLLYYEIFRGTSEQTLSSIGTALTTRFVDGGLADSTTYYYKVRAIDKSANNGLFSSVAFATTSAPLAKLVTLTADAQAFTYDGDGNADPASQTITLTANLQNTTDTTATFTTTPSGITLGGTGNTRTLSISDFGTNNKVTITASADSNSASDLITVYKLQDGADGTTPITIILSNENHTVSQSAGGTQDFSGSGTTISVYEGTTELSYDATGTSNGTYNVTATSTNVTADSTPTDDGDSVTFGNITAMTADVGYIDFTISGKTLNGNLFSLAKRQSFSRVTDGQDGDAALAPRYASFARTDLFAPLSETTSQSLTEMTTGTGDHFLMSCSGIVTVDDANDRLTSSTNMDFHQLTDGTVDVNYIGIMSPDEDGVNEAYPLSTLLTLNEESQIAYNYDGNKAVYNVVEVMDTVTISNYVIHIFKVEHVSGDFDMPNGQDLTSNEITFQINYDLLKNIGEAAREEFRVHQVHYVRIPPVAAGSFVAGQTYWIHTVGTTDFTTIGASINRVGESFIATGSGTGTGLATPLPNTSTEADFQFSSRTGLVPVDKDQVWFYSGTASNLGSTTVHIYNASSNTWTYQTNVIDGNLLVTDTITADKLNVAQLSAISADLGTITVDEAHIGNLSISTGKVQDDAITTHEYVEHTDANLSSSSTNPTVFNYTTTMAAAGDITVMGDIPIFGGASSNSFSSVTLRIVDSTSNYTEKTASGSGGALALTCAKPLNHYKSVPSGSVTIRVMIYCTNFSVTPQAGPNLVILKRYK